MRFTLFNLIVVNAAIAVGLGVAMSDENRIKENSNQFQYQMKLIRAAEEWQRSPIIIDHRQPGDLPIDEKCVSVDMSTQQIRPIIFGLRN